ncbi:hypothetical protein [Croceicoccus sediminis]|uniref:hypothetical protein n=1 Tax=Croceicoccus sediminis TaxID=2571150 RepID=UPI0011840352|nr:hypothetical protein [Croceicoccus sediminis]
MKRRIAAAAALAVVIGQPLAANDRDEELATLVTVLECNMALMLMTETTGVPYAVDPDTIAIDYEARLRLSSFTDEEVTAEMKRTWHEYRDTHGQDAFYSYVEGAADECTAIYLEKARTPAPAPAPQPASSGPAKVITADYLRDHLNRNGDYRSVADFIVYTLPDGKDPFKENAMGELLGQMVVETGAKGVIRFSDAAIMAMIAHRYWQYNPPASRIVDAEYRRRLRVKNYTAQEESRWAQRAAADRAEQARRADAPWVGSIGKHCEKYMEPAGPGTPAYWVTKCR